jgi:hypothetical protein
LAEVEHDRGLCPMSLVCLPAAGISVRSSPGCGLSSRQGTLRMRCCGPKGPIVEM